MKLAERLLNLLDEGWSDLKGRTDVSDITKYATMLGMKVEAPRGDSHSTIWIPGINRPFEFKSTEKEGSLRVLKDFLDLAGIHTKEWAKFVDSKGRIKPSKYATFH